MTSYNKPKLPENMMIVSDDGRHILLHPEKPVWIVVNNSGLMLARLLDGTNNLEDIADYISSKFDIDKTNVLNDIKTFLEELKKARMLDNIPLKQDEPEKFSKIDLYVTENCNLQCIHCAVSDGSHKKDYLGLGKIKSIIDEYKDLGGTAVNLIGGEPLVRKDIKDIIHYAAKRMEVILPTNGVLINSQWAEFLSDYENVSIQISIDGANPETHDQIRGFGTFEKTMNGIESLRKYDLLKRTSFSYVIMKTNIEDVKGIIDLGEKLQIPQVRFTMIHKAGNAAKAWDDLNTSKEDYYRIYDYLYEELLNEKRTIKIVPGLEGFYIYFNKGMQEDMWCNVGRTFCIDRAGDVFPCSLFKLDGMSMGNIFESSLKEIAGSNKFIDFKNKCKERKNRIKECSVCAFRNFCQAGCPARSYVLYDNLYDVDFMCEYKKKLFKKMILECSEAKLRMLKLDDWV